MNDWIVDRLRDQAEEIAQAEHAGWANTMIAAADEITRLREMLAGQDDVGHRYSQASMDAVVGQLAFLREELERIAELDYTFDGAAFTAVCIARVALRGEAV